MDDGDEPSKAEVDAVVAEFDGDLQAAIRALLHDLAALAADLSRSVSWGYVRGRTRVDPLRVVRGGRGEQERSQAEPRSVHGARRNG